MNILVEETMRAKEIALSHDYLTKVLDYNSEIGEFKTNKQTNKQTIKNK